MGPDDDKYREATQEHHLRLLVEAEENEEKLAQDQVLEDPEDEALPAAAGPPEDASKSRSEKEVDNVGSGFLCVVQDAMKSAVQGDDLDKNMLLTQNLNIIIESVIEKCF